MYSTSTFIGAAYLNLQQFILIKNIYRYIIYTRTSKIMSAKNKIKEMHNRNGLVIKKVHKIM